MGASLEGTLINGRYRVLRALGAGGMGQVYLAKVEGPAGFEKLVALKVVHDHIAKNPQVIEMFLGEARLAALLSHASIAQIYDLGATDGLLYIAMEYVRGRDLRTLMRAVDAHEGRIPLPLCVYIVARLCEALDHAHALKDRTGAPLNLVHRDVTPVNCLLSFSGEVKLIDFGIAKAANVVSMTRTGSIRGKLAYMSPEQTRGLPLDRRSDLFALGIVLYELLIGGRPFDLDDDRELAVVQRIRSGKHPRAAELDPEVPEALDRIVEKALAVDRDERYQSAAELHEDLQRFLLTNQIHVTARDLGMFVVQMLGAEVAQGELEPPQAPTTAIPTPAPNPTDKSGLRSRTTPERARVLRTTYQPTAASLAMTDPVRLPPPDVSPHRAATDAVPAHAVPTEQVPADMVPTREVAGSSVPTDPERISRRRGSMVGAVVALLTVAAGAAWWLSSRRGDQPVDQDAGPVAAALDAPVPAAVAEVDAAVVELAKVVAQTPDAGAPRVAPKKRPHTETGAGERLPERLLLGVPTTAWLTVHTNHRSEVFVDGRSIGEPRVRAPVSPGDHDVRVDCLYGWGRHPGETKRVSIPAEAEAVVRHECVEGADGG